VAGPISSLGRRLSLEPVYPTEQIETVTRGRHQTERSWRLEIRFRSRWVSGQEL